MLSQNHHHVVARAHGGGLQEGLCDAPGAFLARVLDLHAELGAVAQQAAELLQRLGDGDQGDVCYAGPGQRADGVVHHRLVEDVEQVLVHNLGQWMPARAEAPCENDAFHAPASM